MILKSITQRADNAHTKLVLLGEDSCRAQANTALAEGERQAVLALELEAGKTEAVKAIRENQVVSTVYGLLPEKMNYDALEEVLGQAANLLRQLKAKAVDVVLGDDALKGWTQALYKQLLLMDDCFDSYQTTGISPIDPAGKAPEKDAFHPSLTVYLPQSFDMAAEEEALQKAGFVAQGIRTARRLVNEPANVLTPERLAQEATALAKEHGFDIQVFDEQQIQQMGMQAFWSVAKGSDAPPRLLVMRYMNNKDGQLLALVGKGLTYDSGGYAIKSPEGMSTMFCDMGGAAAVIGALSTLAAMKARVNVVGIVAACENMISGHSYHNGDIISSLSGKFIEVVNTDAEGRLTLADAITYAATVAKADKIIDIATLTGSVGVALGREITGVVADDEAIWQAVLQASRQSGDKVWRLPHDEHLAKHNKSERADIKNSGGRPAGASTAALFCRAFAFGKPWGHLDIASTAYQDKASAKAPAGATGVGTELLTRAALAMFEE